MTHQELINIGTLVVVAAVIFWQSWRRWGNATEVKNRSDAAKKFLKIEFKKGADGTWHLIPLAFHLRLALSLIPALLAVIASVYLQRLFALI
jgi:hypothetical protein